MCCVTSLNMEVCTVTFLQLETILCFKPPQFGAVSLMESIQIFFFHTLRFVTHLHPLRKGGVCFYCFPSPFPQNHLLHSSAPQLTHVPCDRNYYIVVSYTVAAVQNRTTSALTGTSCSGTMTWSKLHAVILWLPPHTIFGYCFWIYIFFIFCNFTLANWVHKQQPRV